ncbi:TIGR03943 family putative permease subunit [Terrilactibacillus laevilacticus]|uniref:TIGR03943 family putative permease subunit n=1 Tax=Terrilactibacillus laevilacticus TaxID=1380157 RepID=A0ABW5PU73_9BACI|nr:TIGR03943 family protein [Terrilactibacillus laevilacticus]
MFRIIILFGFTYLFLHLHLTGDISKYINMKYSYLSFTMIFVLGFLTVYQIIKWNNEGNHKHEHHHDIDCGHDHSKDENTWYKKVVVYGLLLFPLVTGTFLPIATLDSNVVKAKGFHFAEIDNDKDQYANHQILRPNTSLYYGSDEYRKMLASDLKKYSAKNNLYLDDDNFLRALETIYNYPGNFSNKQVSIEGFVYHGDSLKKNQLFLFRFGIIHCIADAGVFGMMVDFPQNVSYNDDEWIRAEGTLSTIYYQPFKQTIPYLKVTKWQKVDKPKNPYAYRKY